MTYRYLLIDGMLSGTGVRDATSGGYIQLEDLGLSELLIRQVRSWLSRYEDAHYRNFDCPLLVEQIDQQGAEIAKRIKSELPGTKVGYYSHARCSRIDLV